jgi:hypothetical protein
VRDRDPGGLWFEASPGKKLVRSPISINKSVEMELICDPSYTGGISRRIKI